jgi:UDP-N-acetylmuramoyl-L-alanyl-D-glutamate--2,6-diaminopimelate ligase
MKERNLLLSGAEIIRSQGPEAGSIPGFTSDSRKVEKGWGFVAIPGTRNDGYDFVPAALEAGASWIVLEKTPDPEWTVRYPGVMFSEVVSAHRAYGLMASRWFGNPSQEMTVIAVTGTNGKTTVATLLYRLFRELGYRTGLLSTVENRIEDEVIPSTHTTPDAWDLNQLLRRMKSAGCSHVCMEASSHAIHQERLAGIRLKGALFTNITHDHLDYHGTFDHYLAAKKKLFDELPAEAFCLVNADDRRARVMVQNTRAKIRTYSIKSPAQFRGRVLGNTLQGLQMEINGKEVWFHLVGDFNASNLLAVLGAAVLCGEKEEEALEALSGLAPVRGRFERIPLENGAMAIVDYAHTPDALTNVLETIRAMQVAGEGILTVVGCGGNRDAAKRPVMARTAARLSQHVFLTSDNPRFEEPKAILMDMLTGVPANARKKVTLLEDREEAIREALSMAGKRDVVLVAGKGHETYQEIMGVRYPFDDRQKIIELQKALKV